jgi:hypothetical protein
MLLFTLLKESTVVVTENIILTQFICYMDPMNLVRKRFLSWAARSCAMKDKVDGIRAITSPGIPFL